MTEDRGADSGGKSDNNHNNHKDLYHWVYVFGTTVFVGVADFMFFWPENHLSALLVLAAWLGLVAIYELHTRKMRPWGIALVVICLFGFAVITYAIVGPIQIPEIEVTGTLQPGNAPTPPNGCDRSILNCK